MLKKTCLISILFIGVVLHLYAQCVSPQVKLTTFYVSSSIGNDKNDGLSEATPKKHISKLPQKEFVRLRMKCNDVFFERICGFENSVIESYGKGEKPVICGFKILKDTALWVQENNGVWSIDLSDESKFDGYKKTNSRHEYTVNNVGVIYDSKFDKLYGHLVNNYDSLKRNGDFYMSNQHCMDYFKKYPFSKLYWKIERNPRKMGNLAFSMYDVGITSMNNCTIRNIAVIGFSIHGITGCNNCLIEKCQIDLIGGAVFIRDKEPWCRYGNGVEFWQNASGNYVTECLISRTFDCATTIQGNPICKVIVKNNHFVKNRIYHCRQAFEHFLNDQGKNYGSQYENCSFIDNIAFEMGNNEFSSPEIRDCNILSYETRRKAIDIYNNVFYGGNHMYGSWMNLGKQQNTIYLYADQYLFHTHWKAGFKALLAGNCDMREEHVKLTTDSSTFFILKRHSSEAMKIKRKILKQVVWKPNGALLEYIKNMNNKNTYRKYKNENTFSK